MGKHEVPRTAPLDRRIKSASTDLHIIMKDLQRDCKPYWKFSELERELLDIAHQAGKLTADHSRELNARRKLRKEIQKITKDLEPGSGCLAIRTVNGSTGTRSTCARFVGWSKHEARRTPPVAT